MIQKPIEVELSYGEWALAAISGLLRMVFALKEDLEADWEDGTEYVNHVLGALGEAAWHKWRNLWWAAPLNEYKKHDAEGYLQIRTTTPKSQFYKVKPKGKDDPNWTVVFLRGYTLKFEIVGCVKAGWAQENCPLVDPYDRKKPVHKVRLDQMDSVHELVARLKQRQTAQGTSAHSGFSFQEK